MAFSDGEGRYIFLLIEFGGMVIGVVGGVGLLLFV